MDTQAAAWPRRKPTAENSYRVTGNTETRRNTATSWSLARSARDLERLRNHTQHICSPATRTGLSRPRAGALTAATSYGYTGGRKGGSLLTQGLRRRRARRGRRWLGQGHGGEVRRRGRRRCRGGGRRLAVESQCLGQSCKTEIGADELQERVHNRTFKNGTDQRRIFDLPPERPWRKNREIRGLRRREEGELGLGLERGERHAYIASNSGDVALSWPRGEAITPSA